MRFSSSLLRFCRSALSGSDLSAFIAWASCVLYSSSSEASILPSRSLTAGMSLEMEDGRWEMEDGGEGYWCGRGSVNRSCTNVMFRVSYSSSTLPVSEFCFVRQKDGPNTPGMVAAWLSRGRRLPQHNRAPDSLITSQNAADPSSHCCSTVSSLFFLFLLFLPSTAHPLIHSSPPSIFLPVKA